MELRLRKVIETTVELDPDFLESIRSGYAVIGFEQSSPCIIAETDYEKFALDLHRYYSDFYPRFDAILIRIDSDEEITVMRYGPFQDDKP